MISELWMRAADLRESMESPSLDLERSEGYARGVHLLSELDVLERVLLMAPGTITSFRGTWRFLSNFYPAPLALWGKEWPTSEHAYQAAKILDGEQQEKIRLAPTPGRAKRLGRQIEMRPDWDEVKFDLMREVLRAKFADPVLAAKLVATYDRILVEGNTWGDRIWGMTQDAATGRWTGRNMLGRLLMELRREMIKERA